MPAVPARARRDRLGTGPNDERTKQEACNDNEHYAKGRDPGGKQFADASNFEATEKQPWTTRDEGSPLC